MSTQPTAVLKPVSFRPAPRLHGSLTAAPERRVLVWLAHRTPRAIHSDHLTALGFVAQMAAGMLYALSRSHPQVLLLVNVCIVLNWLGDSLDGTLARVRSQQRPRYGFYVDHALDLLGATCMMAGLAASGFVHPLVGMAMLTGFLLLSAESFLATYTLARFQLSTGLFGPTELRLLLVAGNVALLHSPWAHLFGHRWLLFDVGGVIASVGMLITAVVLTARHTAELYGQERVR